MTDVKSKGNYSNYLYTDMNAEDGINYYRLNQMDINGSSHQYNWISITIHKGPPGFSIYPNPLPPAEKLVIESVNFYNQPIQLEIFSVIGQQKLSQAIKPDSNDMTTELDISQLQPGIYLVSLTVNGARTMKKIIVQ